MDIEVGRIVRAEARAATAVAARAFFDDPLMNWLQPDPLRQQRALPGFFAAPVHDCLAHGEVWVARTGGAVRAVGAWLPPGVALPTRGVRALRQAQHALPAMVGMGRRVRAAIALMNTLVRQHPHGDHWYLALLATDPAHQGRGHAGALLAMVHPRADSMGRPAYLETQKEANLAYYRRFGYDVVDELRVGPCPPVWTMERPPHDPAGA